MRHFTMTGVLLAMLLPTAGCPSPPADYGTHLAEGKHFTVAIEQDGGVAPLSGDKVALKKKPFAIVVRFREADAVMVNFSRSPDLYTAAMEDRPLAGVLPLGGRGMVEAMFNPSRRIFITDDGYHFWHYYSPKNHRFDSVDREGETFVCRRVVENYAFPGPDHYPRDIRSMPYNRLYAVFVHPERDKVTNERTEGPTRALIIEFR